MKRQPRSDEPETQGGRAAERLRDFVAGRFPEGAEPDPPQNDGKNVDTNEPEADHTDKPDAR